MPHRVVVGVGVMLAALGLLAVTWLLAAGRNPWRAALVGPRWRRRLVAGGLGLLTALGAGVPGGPPAKAKPKGDDRGERSLDQVAAWKRVHAIMREAEEIGAGKRGSYPFDEKGKKRVLEALAAAGGEVDALQRAGQVTAAEAGLLKKDLERLTLGVQRMRPTELRQATCYKPMMFDPQGDSARRLADRLPLLEQAAAAKRLRPQVVALVLAAIERDLAVLDQPDALKHLPEKDRAATRRMREAVRAAIKRVRKLAGGQRAEVPRDWGVVEDALAAATKLARAAGSTTAERKQVDQKLATASAALMDMRKRKELTSAEADLVVGELAYVRDGIVLSPPRDSQVRCYDMAYLPPARRSLTKVRNRLPLLRDLVKGGVLQPAAARMVVAAARADLVVLGSDAEVRKLADAERRQARETRAEAERLLAAVEKLVDAAP